jgi:hypothetical protein
MLRSLKNLHGYKVSASDGDLGKVVDFLVDDERWVIRYLVVEAGTLFAGRRVLISPVSFRQVDWSTRRFHLALTMEKIKNSPSIDVDKPVSRQHERDYYRYYGYPYYWGYSGVWGMGYYPGLLADSTWQHPAPQHATGAIASGDSHLRSVKEVDGYAVQGSDGDVGHVADFVVDDESWAVRYLTIDTSNWWFGTKVLVAPNWAQDVNWLERKVHIDLTRQSIKSSPPWDADAAISREYESSLHAHYSRPVYWASGTLPSRGSHTAHSRTL